MLDGRRILLGVCGSIAAYKLAEVARELTRRDAEVRVVMTQAATRFVTPATFAALTGQRVYTDEVFTDPHEVTHVKLGRWSEVFVVGAATATTLARLASGSATDMLSASYLMCRSPVLVAPAMHTEMWEHPATQRSLRAVLDDGAMLIEPEEGPLASGDYGTGRLAAPMTIVEAVADALAPKDLAGLRVLVTTGPTREDIDPVRFISNRSTGKMGFAIAEAARRRGAQVTVVAGPTTAPAPPGVELVRIAATRELLDACTARLSGTDVVVMTAAVADWRPATQSATKVKKADMAPVIELTENPDIAAELGRRKTSQVLIAFAAETDDMLAHARRKLISKNADLIVGNVVGRDGTGFESDTNDAAFLDAEGVEELPRMTKAQLADRLWDRVTTLLSARRQAVD